MIPRFGATVSAITYSVVRERCGNDGPLNPNRVAAFILERHGSLPDFMRLPLQIATVGLDGTTLLTTGRPFHLLSHEERWRRIERWRVSPLGPVRNLLRFYEGLAVFGHYGEMHGDPS